MQGEGRISELVLLDGLSAARVKCAEGLVPAPGQYVLAYAKGSEASLASVLFATGTFHEGFITASPIPSTWHPGLQLRLRGPLGHGFRLPPSASKVALVAYRCRPRTLLQLLETSLRQGASVALVGEHIPDELPAQVEAQPVHALPEVLKWADFAAFEVQRDQLPELKSALHDHRRALIAGGQVLIHAPMPCGALAACGVCTVELRGNAFLICDDGPVFELDQVLE
jgi:NAD(P)H-flavin reductase